MEKPRITWGYVPGSEELALFWLNPWSGEKEKIATFWWPGHPPEATETVERWFESYARRATRAALAEERP